MLTYTNHARELADHAQLVHHNMADEAADLRRRLCRPRSSGVPANKTSHQRNLTTRVFGALTCQSSAVKQGWWPSRWMLRVKVAMGVGHVEFWSEAGEVLLEGRTLVA